MHRYATRRKKGFTLAEILLAVMIIVILAAVIFVAVARYQRSTAVLEMDGIAKEIFIAAQNHLALADSQGLLAQRVKAADENFDALRKARGDGADDVYCFFVPKSDSVTDTSSILSLMLPQFALDETVRLGGSYIIRYQLSTATVLDVFYSEQEGERFGHDFTAGELSGLMSDYRDTEETSRRDSRKNYSYNGKKYVIGWYGGAAAQSLETVPLAAPSFELFNDDTLRVVYTNPNSGVTNAKLTLIVRGKGDDGELKEVMKDLTDLPGDTYYLDDITQNGCHFAERCPGILPGSDIEVSLKATVTDKLAKPIVVGPQTTNSLFAPDISDGTAKIASFRHLENLDNRVSGFAPTSDSSVTTAVYATGAVQTTDLVWSNFFAPANGEPKGDEILSKDGASLGAGAYKYFPVKLPNGFGYDGKSDDLIHSVTGVQIEYAPETGSGDAGLFGALTGGTVQNLKLVDFSVSASKGPAGMLAGSIAGTTVRNVLAVCSGPDAYSASDGSFFNVKSTASHAGGLIGLVSSGGVEKCAAAVRVVTSGDDGGDAGGLVGRLAGGSVTASYSGGRTENGAYSDSVFNVTAKQNAGGLVGSAAGSITKSYSTCSASGATAGGLVGTASGAITNCYATGLVSGATAGAFAGSLTGEQTVTGKYYRIIYGSAFGSAGSADVTGVAPLDYSAATYNEFLGSPDFDWTGAKPYDSDNPNASLNTLYGGKYPLRSVKRLGASVAAGDFVATHYGDWPAPELLVVNVK